MSNVQRPKSNVERPNSQKDFGLWTLDIGLGFQSLLQISFKLRDLYAFLFPRIAIAHRHRFILERLMIHGDAERRANLVLTRVEFSNASGIIINSAY